MSFNLFQLVPAVYRLQDAQIAQSMQLLTAAEQTALSGYSAAATTSTDQQTQLMPSHQNRPRPLQSLLMLVEEQLAALAEDLDQLYDDQFIETCAPWVIPYIGDLIGYQAIQASRRQSTTRAPRSRKLSRCGAAKHVSSAGTTGPRCHRMGRSCVDSSVCSRHPVHETHTAP